MSGTIKASTKSEAIDACLEELKRSMDVDNIIVSLRAKRALTDEHYEEIRTREKYITRQQRVVALVDRLKLVGIDLVWDHLLASLREANQKYLANSLERAQYQPPK